MHYDMKWRREKQAQHLVRDKWRYYNVYNAKVHIS
jgi:hypothetical protein